MSLFLDAVAIHRAGDFDRALELYEMALADEPWRAAHNIGTIHSSRGDLAEAEAWFRRALAARPGLAETQYSLAHVLLAQGRYAEGWPLYEARRSLARLRIPDGPPGMPEWRGEALAGRRLLVLGEQGFGDQIMMARFLPELEGQGAEVSYVCRPGLNRLLPGSLPTGIDLAKIGAELWTVSGSLPYRLGATLENLPPPVALASARGSSGGEEIGVVARGRPTHANDAQRSLPKAEAQRLLALGRDLSPEATGAKDFRDTAEIIAGLDLVISVDTAIAHLAGSMGKPTWILLPALGVDWRWMRGRSDSPWYPTARLIRQPGPGRWAEVLDGLEAELR